jgi:hypothetical protein
VPGIVTLEFTNNSPIEKSTVPRCGFLYLVNKNLSIQGVSKLMDVLGETREVLRNDALIVLFKLTKG